MDFKWLANIDWKTIGISVILSIIVTVLLLPRKFVENIFSRSIKKYEHHLETLSKQAEHDFIIRNQDFNLWTTKRHEAYAKIYASLNVALNHLYKGSDVSEYIVRLSYDREPTEEELKAKLQSLEIEKIDDISKACNSAEILFVENQLYFSNVISTKLEELFSKIGRFHCFYLLGEFPENSPERQELTQTCKNLFAEITQLMKRELSGDYRFTAINTEN